MQGSGGGHRVTDQRVYEAPYGNFWITVNLCLVNMQSTAWRWRNRRPRI